MTSVDTTTATEDPDGSVPMAGRLHDLLDRAAERTPDQSFVDPFRRCSVVELRTEALVLAAVLAERGVTAGSRVAVVMANRLEVVTAVMAGSLLGAASAILTPDVPPRRLARLLADLQPACVVASGGDAGVHDPVQIDSLNGMAAPAPLPVITARSDDPVLMLYTSGSTSMPKAVICPQASVCFAVEAVGARLGYTASDRIYSSQPMSFDYGLYQAFLALRSGADLVIGAVGAPDDLQRIAAAQCTVVPVVPSLARRLAIQAGRGVPGLESVRLLTNTGEALTSEDRRSLRATFAHARLVSMFGQTECKRITISDPDEDLGHPGAAGTALPGTELEVHDRHGRRLPPGSLGELVVLGPHVMAGYWNDPVATRTRFGRSEDGRSVLRTGDQVHLDATGRLYFHGRDDGETKVRGVRINPMELEEAAAAIPGVAAAAVIPPSGLVPLTLFFEGSVDPPRVLRGLAHGLGPTKVPRQARALEALPLNERGKCDRVALRSTAERSHLERLARRLGTPLFVYDLDQLGVAHQALVRRLPGPHVLYYSLKANPHPQVVAAAAELGCRLEVSSLTELETALAAAGDPEQILLTGPGKAPILAPALARGCRWFAVESLLELRTLEEAVRAGGGPARAILRVNLPAPTRGGRLPISGGASKFGLDVDLARVASASASGEVPVVGLQFFQASNFSDGRALLQSLLDAVEAAARLADVVPLALLDLGGGFGAPQGEEATATPSLPDFAPLATALDRAIPGWRQGDPLVAFESGRALVGAAGALVCEVTDVKHSGGTRFVLVDSGIHHIGGLSSVGRLLRPTVELEDLAGRPPTGPASVSGPLCTPLDTWGTHELPDVQAGDLLVVHRVGAYALTASPLAFLSHPMPVEAVAARGEVLGARRLQLRSEDIPTT